MITVGDSKWYLKTATGQIPPNRRKFCAGSTWAKDQSSYNIYIYGGYGFGENITGFDDVWILTLPTFEWIKWYPDGAGDSTPHGLLTCNVIDNAQMIVIGGNNTNDTQCDAPDVNGQHNLNLGQLNVNNAKWYQYLPNLTDYLVPPAIVSVTGGSPQGNATNLSPVNGWSDTALSVYFGAKAQFDTRTPTRYIPSPTPTTTVNPRPPAHRNIGPIVGGAIGGLVFLIIIAAAIVFCFRRRRSSTSEQRSSQPHLAGSVNEMAAGSPHNDKTYAITSSVGLPVYSPNHPSSLHSASPPLQTTHPMSYQHLIHGQHQQYPMHMQQPGYGFQQYPYMSGSPPGGANSQQPYFPPPEITRSSPPVPHEMPTAVTPANHHVIYQPTPWAVNSLSSQEHSRNESHSSRN